FGDRYNFSFFGSCDNRATGSLVSLYTIGSQTVQLDARTNTQNTIQINNVTPDELGRVLITIKSSAPGYGFVNSIGIQSVPIPPGEGGAFRKSSGVANLPLVNLRDSSETISMEDRIATVSAYPVPIVNDILLRIHLTKSVEKVVASIIDNNGRRIYSQELNGLIKGNNHRKLNIDGNSLMPGVYFVRLTGDDGEVLNVVKIVK
ncbi:MAG TPA: T9SS type A sorting domain-containing protein, partial [Candidatus Dojkabacteria bacterium]|nr:T9SS type A sorting domain-containing protein [Candidatus Dojkabacteria bacterium]